MLTRFFLSVSLVLVCCGVLFSQRPCKRSSPLFRFDPHARPRMFIEKLGNHPQFPFLQYEKGIVTRALFLKAVKDADSRRQYNIEFDVFNRLLQDIGFVNGYKDLRAADIENLFLNPGITGNLGFFNRESNYIYVKLNPAGEGDDGIAAWKITGPGGCYFYILHTCGNAFVDEADSGRPCPCRGWTTPGKHRGGDTVVRIVHSIDTVTRADTTYIRLPGDGKEDCRKKWEITLDGGVSFNSAPRFDNTTQHSRPDGARPAAGISISRIFNHWFQAGVSASWLTLAYQDDLPYPGSTPNAYNTVYPGKTVIPLQLFGEATIGGPVGWQAKISLSAGYSLVSGDKIVSNGATLGIKPGTKGGPTAGLKMGVAYFFNCRLGLGVYFTGQYFDNRASAMTYHLLALPVTGGIRYRF